MVDVDQLGRELDTLGETAVRLKLSQGVYGVEKRAFVEQWLREREAERDAAESVKRERREEESLRLSREADVHAEQANEIARQANERSSSSNRIAVAAVFIALLALVAQIVQAVIESRN